MGITRDGDLLAAGSYSESVLYYKHPISGPVPGTSYEGITRFFAPPFTTNTFDAKSFRSPRGIALANNQLVVSDHARILFWNNFSISGQNNSRPADGALMTPDFNETLQPFFGRIFATNNSLWAINTRSDLFKHLN